MSYNSKKTSGGIGRLASETLRNKKSSGIAKGLAGSALRQTNTGSQTSAEMESKASGVLRSNKYSTQTKSLAASVLSQSNKERGAK